MPTGPELFWRQSERLFDRWERILARDPARVRRECALYRRWVVGLQAQNPEGEVVREVLLEMLADIMVDATLME